MESSRNYTAKETEFIKLTDQLAKHVAQVSDDYLKRHKNDKLVAKTYDSGLFGHINKFIDNTKEKAKALLHSNNATAEYLKQLSKRYEDEKGGNKKEAALIYTWYVFNAIESIDKKD